MTTPPPLERWFQRVFGDAEGQHFGSGWMSGTARVFLVIHRDFCAENLVRDGAGPPHVIDNEAMHVGALDLDLARTWYRWPMTDRQATAFLEGYAAHRSPASYLSNFPFWILAVLVDASLFHLRKSTGRAADALDPLRAFLDGSLSGSRWIPCR